MKLLAKTSVHYLWVSGISLLGACVLLFVLLKRDISAEIKEQLELQLDLVASQVQKGKEVEFPLVNIEQNDALKPGQQVFRDTLITDPLQNVIEDYYLLSEVKQIGKKTYRITVMTAYIGWDEYFKTIIYSFIILAILLVGAGALVNYFISKRIWSPFLSNMGTLKQFSLKNAEELVLIKSDIDEFEDLNAVLFDFAAHARREYQGLQEFSENASHELQTPISIIRSRLESISQFPLDSQAAGYLVDAKQALNRLSKVNKGLLLLAKLANDNFPDQQLISMSDILTEMVEQYQELFANRGLQLQHTIQPVELRASPHLVHIMLSNLLSNQQKYTSARGRANVTLEDKKIEFKNQGQPLRFAEDKLFTRFKKEKASSESIGLGLAIIKQICHVHKWDIVYAYADGWHVFTIYFGR